MPTCSCEAFSEDQFQDVEEGKKVLPFKILARLVRLAHEAVCPLKPGVKPPARCLPLFVSYKTADYVDFRCDASSGMVVQVWCCPIPCEHAHMSSQANF